jgi:hypothetical protein
VFTLAQKNGGAAVKVESAGTERGLEMLNYATTAPGKTESTNLPVVFPPSDSEGLSLQTDR